MMMRERKVGIFTRPIDQQTSGSGSHLRQLVDHFLQVNDTFDIYLIHYKKGDLDTYKKTKEIIIPRDPLRASIKLQRHNFDILHYSPLSIYSPVCLRRVKKVATIHGAATHFLPNQYTKSQALHGKILVPYYARKMDYIFTVSKTSRDFIIKHYNVDEDKVMITYNGVGEAFRVLDRKEATARVRRKYGIQEPFILHISKYSERKNPWLLLKAFQIIRSSDLTDKKISLVVAGSKWNNQEIIHYVKEYNLENDIVFTGFIPEEDIIDLLNLAIVFVFPSLYEGFGMPNLEAMACGCPVITSRAFAIPEIVGDAALLLGDNTDPKECADKIVQVIKNAKLRNTLITRGLERVKLYSWEESALTVLNTYKRCL